MLDILTKISTDFMTDPKEFQVLLGAVGLWALTILSYIGRSIPGKIYGFIKFIFTSEMTLISTSNTFFDFMEWFEKQGYINKIKKFKMMNNKHYENSNPIKTIGYGTHYLKILNKHVRIIYSKMEQNFGEYEKDELHITVFEFSKGKFFQNLFELVYKDKNLIKDFLSIEIYDGYSWSGNKTNQIKKDLNTVYIKEEIKQTIINHIEKFINNESWYIKNGIPYQTGILLYGPPGCGKTSFLRGLGSYFGKTLYLLKNRHLKRLDLASDELPINSFLIIEDMDKANSAINKKSVKRFRSLEEIRSGISEDDDEDDNELEYDDICTPIPTKAGDDYENLGDMVNAMDGMISSHGRIILATANDIDKIHKVFLRDGRFDLKIEIPYMCKETIEKFMKNYYPDFQLPKEIEYKDKLSGAYIQKLILNNLDNPKEVLDKLVK